VRPRDIILFENSEALVSHRVIKLLRRNGKTLILQKGDAGANAGVIDPKSIQGKVVAVEKNGSVLRFDQGRLGFLNHILGLRNSYAYQFDQQFIALKQKLRDKPWFEYIRPIYRRLRQPYRVLNQALIKAFFI